MPNLLRLRLVSVGHKDARMDDLTLQFFDAEGRPTDSTIWLRNGGGKSSILNLFYAVLRPGKTAFLGNKAESGQRRLEQYIQPHEPAAVICEWMLDKMPGTLDFGDSQRYLTGVFYEMRPGASGEGMKLRRLYFAAPVFSEDDRLTLDGLPIYIESGGKRIGRRTLASFRQEWKSLRDTYPHLQPYETDIQREWQEFLDGLGIDPELFAYQVQMNMREGGAQELFRFKEHEDFVDFFLKMVCSPEHGERVSDNIRTFREDLCRRKDQWLPEKELIAGLLQCMRPFSRIAWEREEMFLSIAEANRVLLELQKFARGRLHRLQEEVDDFTESYNFEQKLAEEDRSLAEDQKRMAGALRLFAAEREYEKCSKQLEEKKAARKEAERTWAIWKAAIPLHNALRYEEKVRDWEKQLKDKKKEHEPLRDDLVKSASRFYAAISHQAQLFREKQKAGTREADRARSEANECREYAAQCKADAAAAQKDMENLEDLLRRADEEKTYLVDRGVLIEGENSKAATQLIRKEIAEYAKRLKILVEQIDKLRRGEIEFRDEKEEAKVKAAEAESEADAAKRMLEEALSEKQEIEKSIVLQKALEVDTIDLDKLPEQTFSDLKNLISQAIDEIIDLKMSRAEDERAQSHLEKTTLLPPTRDVENILLLLKDRIRSAWSGWEYIAENRPNNDARREVIARAPHLATGVIVRDADFDKACEILRKQNYSSKLPVLLAGQSALNTASNSIGVVVGPSSDAYFDREAGREELFKIREQFATLDDRINEAKIWLETLGDVFSRLHDFRKRCPHHWFAGQRNTIERKLLDRTEYERRTQELSVKLEQLAVTLQESREDEIRLNNSLEKKRGFLELANQFNEQFESHARKRKELLDQARNACRKKCEEEKDWAKKAREADKRSSRAIEDARNLAEEAKSIEDERDKVTYLKGIHPEPATGDVASLRDRYRQLKTQYESDVNEDGLILLAREAGNSAMEERRKFRKAIENKDIAEQEVRDELDVLESSHLAEQKLDDAELVKTSAFGKVGNATQLMQRAEERLEQARETCQNLGPLPELKGKNAPADPLQAQEAARDADLKVEHYETSAAGHEEKAAADESRLQERQQTIEVLTRDIREVSGILDNYEDLIKSIRDCHADDAAWTPPAEDNLVAECANQIAKKLKHAREQNNTLDERLAKAIRKIHTWVREQRFKSLKSPIARKFAEVEAGILESHISKWTDDTEIRLKTIEDKLVEIDKNRKEIIKQILDVALEGLQLLRRAAARSALPEQVPGMGGSQFLRITTNEPNDRSEQEGRIANLLDEIVDLGGFPGGIELVQKAVRRVAKKIRVRVLHPDPDHNREYVPIPYMGRFSGGEQLTSAVLLYCTLAKLRAASLGKSQSPSSVLLLDNPIGNSSRVRFLKLQRDVARVMGVQLIYTTAVNDHEALSILPNIIRLKNVRIDRNTGHRMVENDRSKAAGLIDGVRIVRSEKNLSTHSGIQKP